jgi:hypothetical protein
VTRFCEHGNECYVPENSDNFLNSSTAYQPRGKQISGARLSCQQNLLCWDLIFLGPQSVWHINPPLTLIKHYDVKVYRGVVV